MFNIWHKLHSEYQFEGIQKKLGKNKSSQMLPPRQNATRISFADPEYYKGKRNEHKWFTKYKDSKLAELNEKYLHPRDMNNHCFT